MAFKTRYSRVRSVAKMCSLTLWLILTIVWILSTRWSFSYYGAPIQPRVTVPADESFLSDSDEEVTEQTWYLQPRTSIGDGYVLYIPKLPTRLPMGPDWWIFSNWAEQWAIQDSVARRFGLGWPARHQHSGDYFPGHESWFRYYIPLWIFWVPLTLLAAFLWRRRRISRADRAGYSHAIAPRMTKLPSLTIACAGGGLTIATVPFVIEAVLEGILGTHYLHDSRVPDWVALLIAVLIWIAPASLVATLVYKKARWRRAWEIIPRCGACGYNLTGNTTGICPECGRQIEPTAHVPLTESPPPR